MRKKNRYIVYVVFTAFMLANCATHKKVEYNIPERIPESDRANLLAAFERGRTMYELHCARCHGIFTKGRDGIPNFTNEQIDNYSAWAIRLDQKNHAVAAKLNTDQLHEVFMFLRFRKRQGPPTKLVAQH